MLGTLASFLALFGAAALIGQAILAACDRRDWSPLAPAVGLAALCPLAWWAVRLPGEGLAAAMALGIAGVLALVLVLRRRPDGRIPREWLGVALAALALASLPFWIEGRFGILGTGLNPDMSQHLFAADRLAGGLEERLSAEGYPLGPHSLVVAVAALGPSPVHAFDGLALAVAVAACLAPLALLGAAARWRRVAGALCVGFAYLVAAYLVQGAFKEQMQALFLLAFAIVLTQLPAREPKGRAGRGIAVGIPLAVLALGSVYVYSFPGLTWLLGGAAVWAVAELVLRRHSEGLAGVARRALPAAAAAIAVLVAGTLPELGRILDFAAFETFDPDGAGLGNLFDRLSPLQALGIWPSGDFRVEPGDGSVPAVAFYLGSAAGLAALCFGLVWWWRRGELAVPAALAAALLLWAYALIGGTPYQEAKALVAVAPLAALVSVRALAHAAPALVAAAFILAAGGSSLLALANGPVGPGGYSPELAELRDRLGAGSVVVYAPAELLHEQYGRDYLVWELRGNRICVEESDGVDQAPAGVGSVGVRIDADGAVVPKLAFELGGPQAPGPCPFIPDGARADPGAAGG